MKLILNKNISILDQYKVNDIVNVEGICICPIFISKDKSYGIYAFEDLYENRFSVLSNTTNLFNGQSYFLHGKVVYYNGSMELKLFDFIPYKPSTQRGIIAFLETIPGIKSRAIFVYNRFKEKSIDIVLNHPERLLEIKGIGKKSVHKISNTSAQFEVNYKTIVKLLDYGFTNNQVIKILSKFGSATLFKLSQNPYQLLDIKGFSFSHCDNFARQISFDMNHPFRFNAAARHILELESAKGNTYLPEDIFLTELSRLISINDLSLLNNKFVRENNRIYLRYIYDAERLFENKILDLSRNKIQKYSPEEVEIILDNICSKDGIILEKRQKEAIINCCQYDSGVFVLHGSAGTGKTFITKLIVRVKKQLDFLYENKESSFLGLAPTGKATKVMQKNLQEVNIECKTIHRALEYSDEIFQKNSNNTFDENFFIIDESSMMDIILAKSLIDAIPKKSTVIFLGDTKQLPSIGPGSVLRDLINYSEIYSIELNIVKRQTALSGILNNAEKIIEKQMIETDEKAKDFYVIQLKNDREISEMILASMNRLKEKGFYTEDIQVLAPQRTTAVGIYKINYLLQSQLNKNAKGMKVLKTKFTESNKEYSLYIMKNDKVIHTKNDYDREIFKKNSRGELEVDHYGITNGEIGAVSDIYVNENGETIIEVKYENYYVKYSDISNIELAYAITIHKSQGSQWPATIVVASNSNRFMLSNNLLYTAVTRSTDFCVVIGNHNAISYGINTVKDDSRLSSLFEL